MGSFTFLAAMTVLARLFLYIMSCAAIPVLRPQMRGTGRFILRGGYLVPVLGILACLWLMFQVTFTSIWMTVAFILAGAMLYLIARRSSGLPENEE
jgi:amino acid transporter